MSRTTGYRVCHIYLWITVCDVFLDVTFINRTTALHCPYGGTALSVRYSSSHTLKQSQLKNFCLLWLLSFLMERDFNHLIHSVVQNICVVY